MHQNSPGFFPTYRTESALQEKQLAAELTETLEQIPSIEHARVHLSFVPEGVWKTDDQVSSASVVVFSESPQFVKAAEIRSIVAGASHRLDASRVHVAVFASPNPTDGPRKGTSDEPDVTIKKLQWWLVGGVSMVMLGAIALIGIGAFRRGVRGVSK
ncbi:MAG: hypothetical protein JXX29_22265 [Deltaproteobacteria bacterium]|nr:hypothetical protein [Deltaproteobacteria bacterium]MBN2674422.1 hypothetical protein [Deltaproteobacteria bacterium]